MEDDYDEGYTIGYRACLDGFKPEFRRMNNPSRIVSLIDQCEVGPSNLEFARGHIKGWERAAEDEMAPNAR